MAFFLILLVIFLLFDRQRNHIIKYRWLLAIWCTLTVLYLNTQISKLIILAVWAVYLVNRPSMKRMVFFGGAAVVMAVAMVMSGALEPIVQKLQTSIVANASLAKTDKFLSGGYGRGAALSYYISQPINWLGDGPTRYYNPVTREYTRGNTGHAFTYYAEVGLVGLLLSYLVMYLMRRAGRPLFKVSLMDLLSFGALVALSFILYVMNDVSVIMAYCIFAKHYLIPKRIE